MESGSYIVGLFQPNDKTYEFMSYESKRQS